MDDQFGGRTDDDLFYDDFEPVDGEAVVTTDHRQPSPPPPSIPTTTTQEAPAPQRPAPSKPSHGLTSSRYAENKSEPEPQPEPEAPAPVSSQPATTPQQPPAEPLAAPSIATDDAGPPANAPTGPKEKPARQQQQRQGPPAQNAKDHAADREARLQSGANPRQKLTTEELTKKMEQMKVLSAEKTRKFEKAEQDEKQHAQAYARGMQEAKKRQVEADERKKRGEENQRQLNNEREKNRERKLKAMSQKEGGWDEGKEAAAQEESRRAFKGANGGVRGTRRGGFGGGRPQQDGEEVPDVDRFLDDRHRPRGGGRGRGRGGSRGGRDGAAAAPHTQGAKQAVPKTEDFPALPASSNKDASVDAKPATEPVLSPLPKGGKWDDEMEALDALKQKP